MKPDRVINWLALVGLAIFIAGCSRAPTQLHLTGSTMGTYYSIKVVDDKGLPDAAELQPRIDQLLDRVNDQMSTYRPESELSRFNRHADSTPFSVSAATAGVVGEAKRLGQWTGGALDVTVGPLVNLWGFGPEGRPDRIPTAQQIETRRAWVGLDLLKVENNTLIKLNPKLYVDLSSIAKGYGVDMVADLLEQSGIDNYLVEIGGELRLKGHNAEGHPWRVAIERPVSEERVAQQVIEVGDQGIATSGDYRNYFEQDGVRYSHTIDPGTARPIAHRLVSVTVVAPSCMTADGLATALMVMGPEKAMAFANAQGLPVYLLVKTDDGFDARYTDQFKPFLK